MRETKTQVLRKRFLPMDPVAAASLLMGFTVLGVPVERAEPTAPRGFTVEGSREGTGEARTAVTWRIEL